MRRRAASLFSRVTEDALLFANLRTWIDSRTRWEKAAVVIWSAILLFVCVRVFISPESKTVYPIFSASGRFWWTSADLYVPRRPTDELCSYRYSPTFAILVTPFAWLPDDVGGVAWRLFNVGAFFGSLAWLLRTVLQPKQTPNLLAWLLLLTIPLALQSVNNGQANLVVSACMMGTVAAVKEKRWNLASLLMGLAFICKLYPIALGMLLILLYPRQLLCRMPIAAMASLGLPFLCQYPSYVFHQYEHWLVLLRADDRVDIAFEQMYRDLWLLIRLYGLPISRNIYMLAQVLAGAGIALMCWYRQRAGWSEQTLLTSTLALAAAWMMLLGPAMGVASAPRAAAGTGLAAGTRAVSGGTWGSVEAGALRGPRVFGWGFETPQAVSSDGTHVWVANFGASVTELNAATGALVKVIKGSSYGFSNSDGISSDGTHVWVADADSGSVTELNAATGALVKVITGSSYGFSTPDGISSDGTHVWVADADGNSVTELNAATGALVKVITGSSYGFNLPQGISSDGTHVWVANQFGNSVTELNAKTGALVKLISGSSYGFDQPSAISSDGTNVWVPNYGDQSVTGFPA